MMIYNYDIKSILPTNPYQVLAVASATGEWDKYELISYDSSKFIVLGQRASPNYKQWLQKD